MSDEPSAAAHAAVATAWTRGTLLHADAVHSVLMRVVSSLVTVEAAG